MIQYFASSSVDQSQRPLLEVIQVKTIKNLVMWLNNNALRSPVTEFPGDFINSNGKLLVEMIEILSGKKITNITINEKTLGKLL